MRSPPWARALLQFIAPPHREEDVIGDLEEAHRARTEHRGAAVAWLLTSVEAVDVGVTLLRDRVRGGPPVRKPSEASEEDVLSGLGISWLDFKLGFRMLVKFPGLTVVAGLAIAFAIALGAGTFEFTKDMFFPTMPFEGGDRIVEVWNRDLEDSRPDARILHDFEVWKGELRTVDRIGAIQTFRRNLSTERSAPTPWIGVAITADAFDIANTPPLLGRPITAADEMPGAESVVVISHDVWERQFGSDLDVIGQPVRLASEVATVVGVMPEGFGWPRAYKLWTPLQLNPIDYDWGESPGIQVIGRRAPGASLGEVRAEVTTVSQRIAADYPDVRAHTRTEVHRWGGVEVEMSGMLLASFFTLNVLAFFALLVLVAGNVALLLFARTAARYQEIVVRSALGASRGRIVSQLFSEAVVLGALACVVGLLGAQWGLNWSVDLLSRIQQGLVGQWFHDPMSRSTVVYALVFTIVAAVISGVLPAVKVTGRGVQEQLQRVGTGGSGREFGRLWSTIIITQIGVTVAFVPIIIVVGVMTAYMENAPYGFDAEEYLMAELHSGETAQNFEEFGRVLGASGHTEEYAETYRELKRRLTLDSSVRAATVAEQLPGAPQSAVFIEVDGSTRATSDARGFYVSKAAVDTDFFEALNAPMVGGRSFRATDAADQENVVVVDEDFVRSILEDRNALGRRIRINPFRPDPDTPNPNPWLEIVGVVGGIAQAIDPEQVNRPAIYTPLHAAEVYPVRIAVHVGDEPTSFASKLRTIASEVDPGLIVTQVRPLDESAWVMQQGFSAWFKVLIAMGGMGILLATTGIYSIMSFVVSRRTREIGIRVALGADRGRIVRAILNRALRQIGLGMVVGSVLIALFMANPEIGYGPEWWHLAVLGGYLVAMTLVCGIACIVPTQRALGVQPTEALRAEG